MSKMYEKIKEYYDTGLWSVERVKNMVIKGIITEEEYASIVGNEYEEAKLTKTEYQEYLKELEIIDIQQQRADIDYIMLMTGIAED